MTRIYWERMAATVALLTGLSIGAANAAPVTDFRTYRSGTANGTAPALAGQGTNDPVIGDLSGNPASAGILLGYLATPATLGATVGDKITFSFEVHFNDATGLTPSGDNFRFALFDLNGESPESATGGLGGGPTYDIAGTDNTDQFRGFWLGNFGGGGGGNAGSIRQRSADLTGSNNPFTNNATDPAADIGTVSGDTVPLVSDVNGNGAGFDYTGTLTLTRAAGGLIDVSGTFVGTNKPEGETDNIFMSDASVTGSSTYGAVGFLIGGPLSTDQALFTDVDVAVIPNSPSNPADFNGDGNVDSEDLDDWKSSFPGVGADADGDGDSDGDDFLVWQRNVQGTPEAGAVPEPSIVVLAGTACLALVAARRRAKRIA